MNIVGKELNHYLVQVYGLNKTACQLKHATVNPLNTELNPSANNINNQLDATITVY